jgi:hypothetical protein
LIDKHPDQCEWKGPFKNSYIGGSTYLTLKDYTQDMCKQACEEDETIHCTGFDYVKSSRTCYLKMKNRYGLKLSTSTSYEYHERNCISECISA